MCMYNTMRSKVNALSYSACFIHGWHRSPYVMQNWEIRRIFIQHYCYFKIGGVSKMLLASPYNACNHWLRLIFDSAM